jgi:hypothetical protein
MRTVVAVAGRPGSGLLRVAAAVNPELQEGARRLGRGAVVVFRRWAPEKSGRLRRGIVSYPKGSTVQVEAHAVDHGYDYVGVTRFGHRVAVIRPKHAAKPGRYVAPIPGVGPRWVNKVAALGPIPGIGFRRAVKGYHPARDWRDEAMPEVHKLAETTAASIGAKIVSRA